MNKETMFIIWLIITIANIYIFIKLISMYFSIKKDIQELEESEEIMNISYDDFKEMTFELIPDDNGSIIDKKGNRYKLCKTENTRLKN